MHMVLIVLALLFLGMLATFVVLASKAPQKAPRAVVVSRRCPLCGDVSTCKHDSTLFRALPLDVVADGTSGDFPRGTWVL